MHTFCRRRKSTAESLGRSPDSEDACRTTSDSQAASAFPGYSSEWLNRSGTSSLTVAGPRRICTGFPVMPSGTQGEVPS